MTNDLAEITGGMDDYSGNIWKAAVIGTGVVGEWHVGCLKGIPQADLIALCDKDPAAMEKVAGMHGLEHLPRYTSVEALLEGEPTLESVHVCTPSGDHLDPAVTAMRAKKHVICEKPMEISVERIDRLIETAANEGVRLAGIFQNRWDDANAHLKRAAEQGRYGTLSFGSASTPWYRTDNYYRAGGWRGTWRLDGGGAIMNQSIHAVDLLQWIMGPIRTVSAYMSSRIHAEIEVEDTLACSCTFANGAHGTIMGSTAMYPGGKVRVEVGGADGTAVSEGGLKVWRFRDETEEDQRLPDKWLPKKPGEAKTEQDQAQSSTGGGSSPTDVPQYLHRRNLSAIYDAWSAGRDAETHGPEARKAVAIIHAMYESARQGGKPVEVE